MSRDSVVDSWVRLTDVSVIHTIIDMNINIHNVYAYDRIMIRNYGRREKIVDRLHVLSVQPREKTELILTVKNEN